MNSTTFGFRFVFRRQTTKDIDRNIREATCFGDLGGATFLGGAAFLGKTTSLGKATFLGGGGGGTGTGTSASSR